MQHEYEAVEVDHAFLERDGAHGKAVAQYHHKARDGGHGEHKPADAAADRFR